MSVCKARKEVAQWQFMRATHWANSCIDCALLNDSTGSHWYSGSRVLGILVVRGMMDDWNFRGEHLLRELEVRARAAHSECVGRVLGIGNDG